MANIVWGTAGHVDHGKTALVKALSGVDTDRLPEERSRRMTIDIGFASMTLPSGRVIDLVDVPGHAQFIKNMVCGASGIHAALLVVAADDGPMPQTEEHLDILGLLGVEQGVVALTKIDLVDEELLELATDETRKLLNTSVLPEAPILPVSSATGQGLDVLIEALEHISSESQGRDEKASFRLPVDRLLKVPGAGRVVTGTIAAGSVSTGEAVTLYPSGATARVRGLQVRGRDTARAVVGERVGLNLHGISGEQPDRGTVVGAPGSLFPTHLVNARLNYLPRNLLPFLTKTRVRFHTGTSETNALVVLMEREALLPGEAGLAQLRLESKLAPAPGDTFVLRELSPPITVGGGVVLEAASRKYRPTHPRSRATPGLLAEVYEGGRLEAARGLAEERGLGGIGVEDVVLHLSVTPDAAEGLLSALLARGNLISTAPGLFLSRGSFQEYKDAICSAVKSRYAASPLETSMPSEEIRSRLGRKAPRETWQRAVAELAQEERISLHGSHVAFPGYVPVVSRKQAHIMSAIMSVCDSSGAEPIKIQEVVRLVGEAGPQEVRTLLELLVVRGELVRIKGKHHRAFGTVMTADNLKDVSARIVERIRKDGSVTLPEARDLLGIGRHPTQAVLEHLDEEAVTLRVEDRRVLPRSAGDANKRGAIARSATEV